MKRLLISILAMVFTLSAYAQVDRHDVRAGNRKFRKDSFKEAEIDYRKAALKDSLSMAAEYNLASSLYRQQDFEGAGKALDTVKEQAGFSTDADRYYFNQGDVALQKKDYATAVEAFKQSLLRNPGDIDAKENYIYAKLMLQNQQDGGGGQNDQNQDQNNDQNQDQNNDQNQDQNNDQNDQNQDQNQNNQNQNNDQNQDQNQGQQPQESKISPQQAQQMLQAIQAKEKETQDKVNKEKAALLRSKQKDKNW